MTAPRSASRASAHTSTGTSFVNEFRRILPDGSSAGTAITDTSRDRNAVVGAIMDITVEKEVLERMTRAAERMRLAEMAARFGIWEMDLAAGIVKGSAAWAALERVPDANVGRTPTRSARSSIPTIAGCLSGAERAFATASRTPSSSASSPNRA